jgi:hypothetical protein
MCVGVSEPLKPYMHGVDQHGEELARWLVLANPTFGVMYLRALERTTVER